MYMYSTGSTTSEVQAILDAVVLACQESMQQSAVSENVAYCEVLDVATREMGEQIDELEARPKKFSADASAARELEALKATFLSVRQRRHELQIERFGPSAVQILETTTEIRKPFWK